MATKVNSRTNGKAESVANGKGTDNLKQSQSEVQSAIQSTVKAEVALIRAQREEKAAWAEGDDARLGKAVRVTADAKVVVQAQREGLAVVVKNAHRGIHVDLPNGSKGINHSGLVVWINGDSLKRYARSIA